MVALLWGANLGAVYPFVEVVLNGKSMQEWMDENLTKTVEQQDSLRKANEQLHVQIKSELGGTEVETSEPIAVDTDAEPSAIAAASNTELAAFSLTAKLDRLKANQFQLQKLEEKHASLIRFEPFVRYYLPDNPFNTLVLIMILVMSGTLIKCFFLLINMYLVARISQATTLDLQNEFFRKTLNMDLVSFGDRGTGDLVGRIRQETKMIGQSIRTLFGQSMREPFKMAVCFAGAAWLNWRLLIFSMLICPLAGYIMIRLTQSMKRANRRGMEESAKLLDRLFQAITYIKIVKANNMEANERSRFAGTSKEVYTKGMKIALYNSFFRLNNEVLGVFVVTVSVLAGGYLVLNHTEHLFGIRMASRVMGFADLLLFYALVVGISDPLRKMSDIYSSFQAGLVACDRIFPLLDEQPTIRSPKHRVAMPKTPASLEFDSVSFHYSPDKQVLDNVSFALAPRQSLAIVGANGSGKSTLINLLPRFFDPVEGSIKIGGTNINQYGIRDVRKYISLVTQQTMLFNDTITNNIRYGVPSATDQQVREAAIKAHAHEFIMKKLDQGYETVVGEHGGRLSGGQRQRIALARAILRNSPLLILDEATSQIDPESEQLIHQTLRTLIKDRTVIMVSHRMSTLALADMILVLEMGRVADFGTHQELIERCDTYRRIRNVEFRESA